MLTRSEQMSRIRGKGNKSTELRLIAFFKANRVTGWRRHPAVWGKPDFIFRKARVAVFVDGCFWHGCPIHGRQPKSNQGFWLGKIAANRKRDRLVSRRLRKLGWRVLRIWEHELGNSGWDRLTTKLRRHFAADQ